MSVNIAIDGPAGAGKSTIAKRVAKNLGYVYVDTGAMYRTLGLHFLRNNVAADDNDRINELCDTVDVKIKYENGVQQLYLNGENVTSFLRTEEVGNMASACAKNLNVRNKLSSIQKEMAKVTDLVMDGRDIGSAVLPNADVKIFLTASAQVRAERRCAELIARGEEADFDKIKADIEARDYQDSHREHSPLVIADDAVLVDSSYMDIDQVTKCIEEIIREKLNAPVVTAKSAGFCFGVERALKTVYEQIESGDKIYTFGPIIHNEEVVNELAEKGVGIINSVDELSLYKEGTVVIRSHGISKDVHEKIDASSLKLVDATCPFVKRIHNIVEKESKAGKQIIIVGNPDHPEVIGIKGWAVNEVIIVNNEDEAVNCLIDSQKETIIVAQTTFNYNKLKDIVEILLKKNYNAVYMDTVCHATSERQSEAVKIAKNVDAMIVIGSFNSSNTQKLFEMCKQNCDDTFYVQTLSDLDIRKLQGKSRVGITAGASTPKKIIQEVQTHVRAQFSGNARRVNQNNS